MMEQHDHFKALQRVSALPLQRISALDVRDSKDRVNRSVHVEAEPGSGFDGIQSIIPKYRKFPALLYFDWLLRFWIYFDTPAHSVSWMASAGVFFGAIFFIVGTFTSVDMGIVASEVVGNCMGDTYDWTVFFCYLCGNALWFTATSLQIVEALNLDHDLQMLQWEFHGKHGRMPRYKWFGLQPRNLDWWGAISYTMGVGMYQIAAIASIINDCPNSLLSVDAYLGLVTYMYLVAGLFFAVSGALYEMQEISPWLIPGIFVPFSRGYWSSLKWWGLWSYFWGGLLFALGGIVLYWFSPANMAISIDTYNIINAVGFGGGSILFLVGAGLMLARQSRGRCRPRYGAVGRLDPTVHITMAGQGAYQTMPNIKEASVHNA